VAQPAPTTASSPREEPARALPADSDPPLDPGAVERAYLFHRARRAARAKRHRERRWANVRFWALLAVAVAVAAVLAARTLGEIERLFGL
jgi:anti-sigma-K factor RskA